MKRQAGQVDGKAKVGIKLIFDAAKSFPILSSIGTLEVPKYFPAFLGRHGGRRKILLSTLGFVHRFDVIVVEIWVNPQNNGTAREKKLFAFGKPNESYVCFIMKFDRVVIYVDRLTCRRLEFYNMKHRDCSTARPYFWVSHYYL